jgi:6-phosphogluconolactonase/glucosamine-6-phosphate isomerase/deaminase
MLCAARQVLFLALGEAKAQAVRRAFAEPPGDDTPAGLVQSVSGETIVLLDRLAAAKLDN